MGKSKKLLMLLLTSFVLLILAACSEGAEPEVKAEEDGKSGEKYSINVAYGNQPDEPIGQMATKWKELVEEKSEGRIELKLYPSSQLGSEKDVVEQAIMGSNVIVLGGYDFLMDYVPDVGILTGPYLVDDIDELVYLTKTEWFEEIREDLREAKIEVVVPDTIYGERHLMTNEKVLTPEDLKGMKIRVPNNQMSIKTFEAMGASATPTPLGDLYTSLQQGLIDGAENPLPVLQGVKTQEVSKHVSLTGHQKFITPWVGGTEFLDTLPEDLLTLLSETGAEANEFGETVLDEQVASVKADFEEAGVEFHEVDTEPFKANVLSVYEEFPEWTSGLYDRIQELLKEQ
ncbi:C4-dicarboxylate TRAP transporter substrate-binding protein [Planococcus beigongshangi]|uniref:C4-dicarboxylate TRAP transporter substrate-binding protein n=1 Tax=Planococcus beigongshangi TaxID=2782536 RepID=UPI00193BB30D|nr:C4-dicarboxylate TRAP transporter substrate-binding protein [Planococcus beigongshangi]